MHTPANITTEPRTEPTVRFPRNGVTGCQEGAAAEVKIMGTSSDASGRRVATVEVIVSEEHDGRRWSVRRTVKMVMRPNKRRNAPRLNHAPD